MATAILTQLTAGAGRRFAFTVGAALLVVGGISAWRGHLLATWILWTLGGALLLSGMLIPTRLGRIHGWWRALGNAISKVTQPIVLGEM